MKFSIEVDNKLLEKIYGKEFTQNDFNKLCSEAITSKIFDTQFMPSDYQFNIEKGRVK